MTARWLAIGLLVSGVGCTSGTQPPWVAELCPKDPVLADLSALRGPPDQATGAPQGAVGEQAALRAALDRAGYAQDAKALRSAGSELEAIAQSPQQLSRAQRALLEWMRESVARRRELLHRNASLTQRLREAEQKIDALTQIERRMEEQDAPASAGQISTDRKAAES